jgi:hypothetical protein
MTCALRPISPADETALIEFHDRCSEETQYLRFAAAKPQLRPCAREEGFTRLVTDVLQSNCRMRRLARDYELVIADL